MVRNCSQRFIYGTKTETVRTRHHICFARQNIKVFENNEAKVDEDVSLSVLETVLSMKVTLVTVQS